MLGRTECITKAFDIVSNDLLPIIGDYNEYNTQKTSNNMKLRSGKIINLQELPVPLNNALQEALLDFKDLFSPYKEHIKDLVHIIVSAKGINARFAIREKIDAIIPEHNGGYMGTVGELTWLTVGIGEVYRDNDIKPIYRGTIEKNIEDFAAELLGDGEF